MTPGKAGAERSDFPLRKGVQVQQGEEMPGDNTDTTDGQQGQDERASAALEYSVPRRATIRRPRRKSWPVISWDVEQVSTGT